MPLLGLKLSTRLLVVTAAGFLALWGAAFLLVENSNDAIIERQARLIAQTVNEQTLALRAVYTSDVVGRLTADFLGEVRASATPGERGEIPLPAVLVHMVNDQLAKQGSLVAAQLISGWNINPRKGLRDEFEKAGWQALLKQQEALKAKASGSAAAYAQLLNDHVWEPFTAVEVVGGRKTLRFMSPDAAAAAACVTCHNALEQRGDVLELRKAQGGGGLKEFRLGEVMGALSVSVPIDDVGEFANGRTTRALTSFFFLMLLVLGGVFVMIRKSFKRVHLLTRKAARIVHEGDFTQELGVTADGGSDEVGQLAASFGLMVGKMREILTALRDSARLLTESSDRLTQTTFEQSQIVTRQAAALQETQVTAQEIKQTSMVAAEKAGAVLKVAERADAVSRSGETAIEQSLGGLTDIRSQVDEIAVKINQLREHATQVGGITQTVKDLADQSNMLALNAAIEAVRSGEHGKGFAVVAREIRSLADQSIQATNRVKEILDSIGNAIHSAVTITEKGSERIEGGLVQVKTSGENLRELASIVQDNSAGVRQIAAAVSQQSAGVTQIFTAVTDMSKMMDDSVQRLNATTQAAASLKDAAGTVSDVLKRYRF